MPYNSTHLMDKESTVYSGSRLNIAKKALIMLHGRGGTAKDILSLSAHLNVKDFALVAPQATNHSWYPYSFLARIEDNEPWLSASLGVVAETLAEIENLGIPKKSIYFLGFSQGACLALEFIARHATRYGGVAAFTGGLIGDRIYAENYSGDFRDTPVFIGTRATDPHVPVARVHSTAKILKQMHADVTEEIYTGKGHIITQQEVEKVNILLFNNR